MVGTLTAKLHLMMPQSYKPTSEWHEPFCNADAFPSDWVGGYPVEQSERAHMCGGGRSRVFHSTRSILAQGRRYIERNQEGSSEIALVQVLFGGLYAVRWFPMKSISKAAKGELVYHSLSGSPTKPHELLLGMDLWVGLGPGGGQCTVVLTWLTNRLRRLVHVQVHDLWTWRDRRFVYSREEE